MIEPSENIYQSFSLFTRASLTKEITEMSAGVNWQPTMNCVKEALQFEIQHDLSYRNYGRSVGAKYITDIIEICEQKEVRSKGRISCALTNGATDGAHCLFSSFLHEGLVHHHDTVAMIGVSFPVYSSLMNRFGIQFVEVTHDGVVVPEIEFVLEKLTNIRPRVIVLSLPHNPSGVLKSVTYYEKILSWARTNRGLVIVDRVCLMPWDDTDDISRIVYDYIREGVCFVIDSQSKSLSLAGLRLGFVLMDPRYLAGLEAEIRARSLNPVVFGTLTLALCRMGQLARKIGIHETNKVFRFARRYFRDAVLQYPSDFTIPRINVDEFISDFVSSYVGEINVLKERIANNYRSIVDVFEDYATRDIVLDAGFNVLLQLPGMINRNEILDQEKLALQYGVCILSERCFRDNSSNEERYYYIRLSLSVPEQNFRDALLIMKDYYGRKTDLLTQRELGVLGYD